jgi:uncharacterized membrane protein YeaQ/YmgE (transglycosylase-associated protein family)
MFTTVIIGIGVGLAAQLLTAGEGLGGIFAGMFLGTGGSIIAGFVGRYVGWHPHGTSAGYISSATGALVMLVVYRFVV